MRWPLPPNTALRSRSSKPWIRTAKRTARLRASPTAAAVARDTLAAVQTPQVFRADLLRRAYEAEYRPEFTDDASVVEQAGEAVFLCEGERTNLKITTPEDMVIAEALLAGREKTEESADGENL